MTIFEAPMGGAFDRLNWQHSGEFEQNFSIAPGIDRYIIFSFILLVCYDMFSLIRFTLVFFCFMQLQRKPLHHQMEKQQLSDQVKFRMTQVGSQDKRRYLALINRARGLYGRILTEVVSTDRTQ